MTNFGRLFNCAHCDRQVVLCPRCDHGIPVQMPKDPRLRDIAVRDHDLGAYDGLAGEPEEDSEE